MSFQYKVRDALGNTHQGTLDAATLDDAQQQLRGDGFQVLQLDEADDGLALFQRRVRKNELIYVTTQLAIMVDTGITLSTALDSILQEEQNPTLRKILGDLKNSVEGGSDFSSALARHPKLFDKTYISMIRASEATGSLGEMLDRVAIYLRKELETRSRVRAAMAYPTVMMAVAIGVTIFLLTYVLPKFAPLFDRKGVQLPKPTVIMMSLSGGLINYWYLWVASIVALTAAFIVGKRTEPGRQAWDWVKLNFPIVGTMFRKVTISRSIRTLGTLMHSGVPLLESITLCEQVAGNYHYEQAWKKVREHVTGGNQICEALRGNPLFPPMLVQMISSGEETGRIDEVLERVSNYYDQEVETSLKTVTSLIEPIMITIMGVIVGGIGMALLLPIFTLSRSPG